MENIAESNKLLLIDDNPLVLDVLKNLFTSEKYDVQTSLNGEEALQVLSHEPVDLIVCDVMMPQMDGYELQSYISSNPDYSNIPFVFLSALGDNKHRTKGYNAGADAYLVKPFDPEELLAVVSGKIEKSKKLNQSFEEKLFSYQEDVIRKISHEFRTPLVAVKTGSELLLNNFDKLENSKAKKIVGSIWKGGQRLHKLVNDFLLMQQIRSGLQSKYYNKNAANFDIQELLEKSLGLKILELKKAGFEVDFINTAVGRARVLPTHFQIIIDHILSNAEKFSKENKKINISAISNQEFIILKFRDYGVGFKVTEEVLAQDAFKQLDREKNEQQGIGLGLTIIKDLSQINQIDLSFNNDVEPGVEVILKLKKVK